MSVNKKQVFGLIRHALTVLGVVAVMSGKADKESVTMVGASIMVLLVAAWSVWEKRELKNLKSLLPLLVIGVLALAAGCSTIKDKIRDELDPEPEPAPVAELDLTQVRWLGANYSGAQQVIEMESAWISGAFIACKLPAYSWDSKIVGTRDCDAICCLFYEQNGVVTGGKFDWWAKGGQRSKVLENVHNGYGGHRMPSPGTPTWYMVVDIHGRQRSNPCRVDWNSGLSAAPAVPGDADTIEWWDGGER
jgi:hypothetical protein